MPTAKEFLEQIKSELGSSWLARIYKEQILPMRTRAYGFERHGRSARVEVQHSLLGVELKIGNRRLLCPDLATARYLAVFARVGATNVAVPYDITKVSRLADELDSSWYRMLLLANQKAAENTEHFKARLRGLLIAKLRAEIAEAGAGAQMPKFDLVTRQGRLNK
ncbi:MAG TPA: hypothetical protein VJ023_18385 [Pyrinomonadaceae bacterium]|nr:hypothetical protein [Pyrinomonadaceae bacterium]